MKVSIDKVLKIMDMNFDEVMKLMEMTDLMIATKQGDREIFLEVLKRDGYNPNLRDIYGYNAENWAKLYDRFWEINMLEVSLGESQ